MSIKHYISELTASSSYIATWKLYLTWDVSKLKLFDLMWDEDLGTQAYKLLKTVLLLWLVQAWNP